MSYASAVELSAGRWRVRVVSETVLRPRPASLGLATVLLEAEAGGVRPSAQGTGRAARGWLVGDPRHKRLWSPGGALLTRGGSGGVALSRECLLTVTCCQGSAPSSLGKGLRRAS